MADIHAPDSGDLLTSAALCAVEDPLAERSYVLADVDCKACLAVIDAQPGILSWMIERPAVSRG